DRAALRGAYTQLTSILQGAAHDGAGLGEKPDLLLTACRLVGAVQGIAMRDRPEGQPAGKQGDKLAQICAASRVRSRRVILRDDWWRRDNGPLVAFRAPEVDPKTRLPVALLPTSARSCVL